MMTKTIKGLSSKTFESRRRLSSLSSVTPVSTMDVSRYSHSSSSSSTSSSLLFSSSTKIKLAAFCCVLFVIFEYSFMSVEAIRCYQCNTKNNQSCDGLIPQSNLFLDDCADVDGKAAFCRKVALTIEYRDDYRVVRSCGYTPYLNRTDRCYSSDNEGYLEHVCQCFSNGCNAATTFYKFYQNLSILVISVFIIGLISSSYPYCI